MAVNIDRTRDLVVLAPRRVSGKVLKVGDLLTDAQKLQLSTRMLNLFAANRWIGYAEDQPQRSARIGKVERVQRVARVVRTVKASPEDGQREGDTATKREDLAETKKAPKVDARAEERESPRRQVKIPKNWEDMKWNKLRTLAAKLTDTPVHNKEEATAAVEAELALRQSLMEE